MTDSGPAPAFGRVAPAGFTVPHELAERAARETRETFVMKHGFSRSTLKPEWWAKHDVEIRLPSTIDDEPCLTRRDLFDLGSQGDSDDQILDFVWHVLAWGSGYARRNNLKRIATCRANVALLGEAIAAAREGQTRTAYNRLIARGAAPYLGPAFFSKILYFASGPDDPICLILDARVARSLHRLGWSLAPGYPSRTFFFRWYTDTYVSYCETMRRWAIGTKSSADVFERLLFDMGQA